MGLFDWLRPTNSNVQVLADAIWLSKQAKLSGIARSIEERGAETERYTVTLLVAQFQDCLVELQELAERRRFDRLKVVPILAGSLPGLRSSLTRVAEHDLIDIVVSERHPLRDHDDAILEVARSFSCRCRVIHHLSLDDPLMRAYAGEWVQNILKRLGMSEDEAIQSQMVTRRFQQAQKEIARKAVGDSDANSAEEWLSRNCPRM